MTKHAPQRSRQFPLRRYALGTAFLLALGIGVASLPALSPQDAQTSPTVGSVAMAEDVSDLSSKVINGDLIRVGISDNSMQAQEYPMSQITGPGAFKVKDKATGTVLLNAPANEIVTISRTAQGFLLKTAKERKSLGPLSGSLVFEPNRDNQHLKIANITRKGAVPSYRGLLEVVPGYSSPLKFSVVNVLSLQDYLKAVVPNELPARYGFEAVKAQAVAARNYAIRPREKPWPQFDICDSQYCQAYYGSQTESDPTTQALAETEGLVALYDGEPILALYSSSHGGVGEKYAYAFSDPKTHRFPATDLPYLQGGPDVPTILQAFGDLRSEGAARQLWTRADVQSFDVQSPHYRWTKTWSASEITAILNKTLLDVSKDTSTAPFVSPAFKPGSSIGTLKRITISERGVSGKAMAMTIEGSNGTWTVKKEFVIRKVLQHQGRMLPSANIVVSHLTNPAGNLVTLKVDGGGFGHGVGMSQLGASWMGKNGHAFPNILQHYYKGISIGSIPVTVGPGHYLQPVRTTFFAKQNTGTLWIETPQPAGPVTVRLNGDRKVIDLAQEAVKVGPNRYRVSISGSLMPNLENSITLYPDKQNPSRTVKAWVELYPPKTALISNQG